MCSHLQDHRFSDEIDKLTGYKTQSILCMAICNSDGEVIGVVQAINKNPIGTPFTEDDEKVSFCYDVGGKHLQFTYNLSISIIYAIKGVLKLLDCSTVRPIYDYYAHKH